MSIPRTRARNAYPGDRAQILLSPATDTAGRAWSPGEAITPLAGGADNVTGGYYLACVETRFETN